MPRTVDEILKHADELAARFEERSAAEQHVIDAIRAARKSGMSWSAIGAFVGTSGEAARQRYSDKVA